jgi:hypothetical protein
MVRSEIAKTVAEITNILIDVSSIELIVYGSSVILQILMIAI